MKIRRINISINIFKVKKISNYTRNLIKLSSIRFFLHLDYYSTIKDNISTLFASKSNFSCFWFVLLWKITWFIIEDNILILSSVNLSCNVLIFFKHTLKEPSKFFCWYLKIRYQKKIYLRILLLGSKKYANSFSNYAYWIMFFLK